MLFYAKSLFDEAGLAEPPHKYGDQYTMPDGTKVDWNYDTIREVAKLLTVDKNGKDATQAGFDPANIVQWGFEPQRDDLRGLGAYFGAGSLAAADGKTAQIPDAWKAAWKFFTTRCGPTTSSMTGPHLQQPGHQPRGLPVLHRQDRDERELPVVDLRPRGPRGRLGHGHHPVLQRAR